MIEKIELTNFKTFQFFSLDQLSRITLLGGENSVGKTSVLEAVFLFFDRGNPEMIIRQFAWRGISRVYLSTDQLFSPIFYDYSTKDTIVISLTINGKPEKLRISFSDKLPDKKVTFEKWDRARSVRIEEKPVVHGKLELEYHHGGQADRSQLVITAKGLTLRDEQTKPERRQAVYISQRVPASIAEDSQKFGALDLKNRIPEAVEFLKKFDMRIRGLSSVFYGDSSVIHADIGISRKVPLPQLGEGLSFIMSMYLAMSSVEGGTLLIDEIGAGLHHSILPTFWTAIHDAARNFDCQLIATSHSDEVIEAATIGLKSLLQPEFTYIRLDRSKDKVIPSPYSFPVLSAAVDSGWEVR